MSVKSCMSALSMVWLVATLRLVALGEPLLQEQEAPQQQQPAYTQAEYEAYQKAVQGGTSTIIEFVQSNPKSSLVQYAIGSYVQKMQELQQAGNHQQVVADGEKLLELDPENLNALYMTAYSAFQIQQFDKAARYGEKVYQQKPDVPGLSFLLAISNQATGNQDKYVEYGKKAVAELKPEECYQILADLTRIYAADKQWNEAASYATEALKGLEGAQKPPQTSEQEWNKYITEQKAVAYAVLGRHAFENKRWSATLTNYQRVRSLNANPALNGEAYYYIGMTRWQQGQIDPAMEAFARGSKITGAPHAKPCRELLEKLYRSTHNDSLAGLDEFISRATRSN